MLHRTGALGILSEADGLSVFQKVKKGMFLSAYPMQQQVQSIPLRIQAPETYNFKIDPRFFVIYSPYKFEERLLYWWSHLTQL